MEYSGAIMKNRTIRQLHNAFKLITTTDLLMKKILTAGGLSLLLLACSSPESILFDYTADSDSNVRMPSSITLTMQNIPDRVCLQSNVSSDPVPAQIEADTNSRVRIWWFHDHPAGESVSYTVLSSDECPSGGFEWDRLDGDSIQLTYNGSPVIQYEHPVFDADDIENTKKPFHHLFDPERNMLITKGVGGLYPHHRGIYYGYNKIVAGDQEFDVWHAHNGERTEHAGIIEETGGPVFGGHIVEIDWKDTEGETVLEEEREVRVTRLSDNGYMVDLDSKLTAVYEFVELGGDLQHAGVQFRAAQFVADNSETTQFIRPSDWSGFPADEELDEANWSNLPWNAMHFTIDNNPYTVVYMSHPSNPGDSQMSERRYGRFGEFIPHQLSQGETFQLRYRFWVVAGNAPSVEEIEEVYSHF